MIRFLEFRLVIRLLTAVCRLIGHVVLFGRSFFHLYRLLFGLFVCYLTFGQRRGVGIVQRLFGLWFGFFLVIAGGRRRRPGAFLLFGHADILRKTATLNNNNNIRRGSHARAAVILTSSLISDDSSLELMAFLCLPISLAATTDGQSGGDGLFCGALVSKWDSRPTADGATAKQ